MTKETGPPAETAPVDGAAAAASPPEVCRTAHSTKVDRKLLDDIFGDVLPDTTTDERDPGGSGAGRSEQWYRENRPPHHGE